jgi:hypothetical protein
MFETDSGEFFRIRGTFRGTFGGTFTSLDLSKREIIELLNILSNEEKQQIKDAAFTQKEMLDPIKEVTKNTLI